MIKYEYNGHTIICDISCLPGLCCGLVLHSFGIISDSPEKRITEKEATTLLRGIHEEIIDYADFKECNYITCADVDEDDEESSYESFNFIYESTKGLRIKDMCELCGWELIDSVRSYQTGNKINVYSLSLDFN